MMNRESDRDYIERRAQEERARAEAATDPCAYKTHLELAREYERRLFALTQADETAAAPRNGLDDDNNPTRQSLNSA